MTEDLMKNYALKGMKRVEIINLLGSPDISDTAGISYQLAVDYGHDIDITGYHD